MALASGGDNCIGFKAVIDINKEGDISSKLYIKTASKPVHGPIYDNQGNVEVEGDPEFKPKMVVTSKP